MLIIMYVMDCLRQDFLGCYGSSIEATPCLDRLARDGVVYERTYANSSWSFPSMVSMLTGEYSRTLETLHEMSKIPQYVSTLPEILRAHKFDTVAISSSSWFAPNFGVRGFERFESVHKRTDLIKSQRRHGATPAGGGKVPSTVLAHSEDLNAFAFEELERASEHNLFMMMWSLDTHPPYYVRGKASHFGNSMDDFYRENSYISTKKLIRLYCDMLFHNDEIFGMLMTRLKEIGLYDSSLIVVLGDHGVSFAEHNVFGHGGIVYEEQIRVPLIMKYPNNDFEGFRQSMPVQSADLLPTVLEVCDIPLEQDVEGISILPTNTLHENRVIFSETHQRPNTTHSAAVIRGKHKFVRIEEPMSTKAPTVQKLKRLLWRASSNGTEVTYDLSSAEGEDQSVPRGSRVHKEMAREFSAMLDRCERRRMKMKERASPLQESDTTIEVDPELVERLKSLGYLE